MATTPADSKTSTSAGQQTKSRPRKPNYNHIHRHLLPIEIHPLPVLIPHNPISVVAYVLSYLTQVLYPPLQPTYNGYFSSATSSIHVTDNDTIKKLWEMGFFGRGSLSRSEPTWLENQKRQGATAEENTAQRREQRRQVKLERAKKEQEEIEKRLSEEMRTNSNGNLLKNNATDVSDIGSVLNSEGGTPTESLRPALSSKPSDLNLEANGSIHGFDEWKKTVEANGLPTPPPTSTSSEDTNPLDSRPVQRLQRTKTVRFSPTIEAREFDLSSPVISPIKSPGSSLAAPEKPGPKEVAVIENQEHLNLSLEEAFFLSYGLGVLNVYCDDSDTILPPASLLSLYRRHSYHPPRSLSVPAEPDDPFMLSYVAYHHYRSAGWVVRSGIKFGTDYLLYNRGPAFSHAEFSITILPSYSHAYWRSTQAHKDYVAEKTKKTWWWLHGVNRVQAQVHKQLIICYVDVPPPFRGEDKGRDTDIGLELSRYKVRDVAIKRWTPNRTRD
ncbi:tRNA-intron endonuclease [Cyphellophora europaea CBS 101466]|uniref:tRNA-intron lyase n=1 Tax=Cyphellophora europaea (strain CBS 101466) TaxID=1220924 RepID=W2S790_CYPE1|nr:tRNA-intron endonuclease [Cyphellophora europaea CBS 101466]ETN44490.1 tRNA-intron endonuclease [Cyphellophora europaea CBS 101466]